ncbi:MAG: xanthine dehydrogenase family protein molybdopterin-binding subunit [Spirochaetales bacterium]|nr:xanthine dehydrogenase family protein molybdopterin-binding subunit [Spirochaetales bacterium]
MSTISRSIPRTDSPQKSAGRANYLDDMRIAGALHARLLLSTRPRARILRVETPALPDGYVTVDHSDIPGTNAVRMINDGWPLFPVDMVEYVGQPILLIAGPDVAVIDELLAAVTVEYEDLTPVFGIDGAETVEDPECFVDYHLEYHLEGAPGPTDQPSGDLAFTITETFDTGAQEHIYLEPQAMAAWCEGHRITVTGSIQCPYYVHKALVTVLGWDADRIRVVQATTGGAFGGKEDFPSVLAGYVALAAHKTGQPVKLVLDRGQDIEISTKRHPSRITLASSVGRSGLAQSTCADIRIDGGAFEGLSSTVLQRAMFNASGVYRIPEISVQGQAYRTNIVPYGAFRGFGSPQAFFASEMHMCHLARKHGEDPLSFKRRHLVRQGDRTITGGTLRDPVKMEEMIDSVLTQSEYNRKRPEYERATGITRRGIGVSLFNHGCGFTGSGERDIIKARVKLRGHADGKVEVLCSNVEMGQGAETTLRKIVAETLGVPIGNVVFQNPDTDQVPDSGPTVASRTVMVVGGLLHTAALKLKDATSPGPGQPVEVEANYQQPAEIEWDQSTFTGDAYPAFSWGVNIIEIELDLLTYAIRPLTVWASFDIGTAIDERIVIGQIHGGIAQGIGYGTTELLEVRDGAFQQRTMTDYVIPGSLDTPEIHVNLVSNPYHGGPFGAKGVGEIPLTGPPPALGDAVECALGVEIHQIPLTPEYLERIVRTQGGAQ